MNKVMLLYFLISIKLCAQHVSDPNEQIIKFYNDLEENGGTAIINLMNTNKYFSSKPDMRITLQALADKLDNLTTDNGKFNGYTFFRSYGLDNVYEIHEYLTLYENLPILFQFTFYENGEDMLIHHFSLSSAVSEIFELNYKDYLLRN